jgi:hypothetical protein
MGALKSEPGRDEIDDVERPPQREEETDVIRRELARHRLDRSIQQRDRRRAFLSLDDKSPPAGQGAIF